MRVFVADDDPTITARRLEGTLAEWGHAVLVAGDGERAWELLARDARPAIAILDWEMPGCDGLEICRRLGRVRGSRSLHAILLTARTGMDDLVQGLGAGADDYLRKPFEPAELRARVEVGVRSVELQEALRRRLLELEEALSQVQRLQGLLPICCYCKKIRDDKNYWHQVEQYVSEHADVQFSHGICPECYEKIVSSMRSGT
jgi:DNA-binding response OmpR family regulator